MSYLSPALRDPQIGTLSAAIPLARLVQPYQRIDTDQKTILYFLKVGAAKGSVSARRLSPEVARQVAMLTLNHRAQTFNLHWFPPGNEEPQVHVGLPATSLAQAVSDLADCGFAAPTPPPVAAGQGLPALPSVQKRTAVPGNRAGHTLSLLP